MSNSRAAKPVEILLIEDNPGDVRLAREVMKEGKVLNTLHVVQDGEAALEFLHRRGEYAEAPRPGLILLDLNLPRKDGREVLAEIKGDARLRNIPVIVLTTSKADEDIARAYDLHANCFITKPIDLDKFIEVMRGIENFWLSIVQLPAGDDSE